MMNSTMKSQCDLAPGTIITGKWLKHSYTIVKQLGAGANGVVYLAQYNGQLVALKISDNYAAIASEMNVLKSFSKVQGSSLGPYLFHGDDMVKGQVTLTFYVMEYIEGQEFLPFVKAKGKHWVVILLLQLLSSLEQLHKNGWIFGDLKPENLIVTFPSHQIRCVDVGGTTNIGRSVKEFTEFFDRGYWGAGSRKAEPSYDLFSVAMVWINAYYPQRFNKNTKSSNQLLEVVRGTKELVPYKKVLQGAISGSYTSAEVMRTDILKIAQGYSPQRNHSSSQSGKRHQTRATSTKKSKKSSFAETIFLLVIVCCLYGLYLYTIIVG
ncbi:protein kinase domain-containing protein [Bacillus massiliigorillae]|uniref:protein kinase domain-containing protein n=1 Tax=Bacillus massiliigorillae TaxID=1243664 RepID=UPI0005AA7C9A|nr:serine/threonine-protein kinase [Bacillus massiliigorillae]